PWMRIEDSVTGALLDVEVPKAAFDGNAQAARALRPLKNWFRRIAQSTAGRQDDRVGAVLRVGDRFVGLANKCAELRIGDDAVRVGVRAPAKCGSNLVTEHAPLASLPRMAVSAR